MLTEIRLYGWLGEKYGKVHYYAVDSVREAVKALQTNFPTFSKDIIEYKPGYKVWSGTTRLGKNDLVLPVSNREIIRIAPAVAGSKGIFEIIVGAALMIFAPEIAGFIGINAITPAIVGSFGLSLVMGGVAGLLAPSPKTPEPKEADTNKPSYIFNGAVNTTAQGHPVPIGYGRLIVGSAVISAGISTVEY